jgi:hypothetical protein
MDRRSPLRRHSLRIAKADDMCPTPLRRPAFPFEHFEHDNFIVRERIIIGRLPVNT